jgi:hypothetical protein
VSLQRRELFNKLFIHKFSLILKFKKLKVTNGTFSLEGAQKEAFDKGPWKFYPNGIVKTTYELSDDLDEKIVELTYFEEINLRNNKFNGNIF